MGQYLTRTAALRGVIQLRPALRDPGDLARILEEKQPWALCRRSGAAQFLTWLREIPARLERALDGHPDPTKTIAELRGWSAVGRWLTAVGVDPADAAIGGMDTHQYIVRSQEILFLCEAICLVGVG